jgi:hypothetical protein
MHAPTLAAMVARDRAANRICEQLATLCPSQELWAENEGIALATVRE